MSSCCEEIKQLLIKLDELADDDMWRPEEERETKKELIDSVPLLLKALELALEHYAVDHTRTAIQCADYWLEKARSNQHELG